MVTAHDLTGISEAVLEDRARTRGHLGLSTLRCSLRPTAARGAGWAGGARSVVCWFMALLPENASLHPLSSTSQLKRASSEDTLNKPGAAVASGAAARLKKTSTSGAISELTESRLRGPTGRREWGQGGGRVSGRWG